MAAAADLTISDVERLLGLMKAHGVVLLDYRGLKVQRVPEMMAPRSEQHETEFDILKRKPPDTIDAALQLRRNRGNL